MTSTPPFGIISIQEPPPTPRYGPTHDDFEPRYSTRSSRRITLRDVKTTPEPQLSSRALRSATTPESKRPNAQQSRHNLSPPLSPHQSPKHNSAKRVQVLSPSSPGTRTRSHDTSSSNPSFTSSNQQQSFLTNTTVIAEGMLPTPVKTPRKKTPSNVKAAARALFQEQPTASEEIMPTPKKNRKSKRHNGFSLETIATGDGAESGVEIFTDSRDNVPELDLSEENPFVDHASDEAAPSVKRDTAPSKRRKVGSERKRDPQVEEAIRRDDGMVYVFRGKKVFRRFDDCSEEEETTIDPNDVGLLEQLEPSAEALKLLEPLTRRSIKPTRLFQTEEQKRAREVEKAEEEMTDIEEEPKADVAESSASAPEPSSTNRRPRRTAATQSTQTPNGASSQKKIDSKAVEANGGDSPVTEKAKKAKRGSPFDSWRRSKSGNTTTEVASSKGRKRASSGMEEGEQSTTTKKLRNR